MAHKTPPAIRPSLLRLRRLMAFAALSLLALAAVRLSYVDGWLRRVTIDGPSMAPALRGTHYDVRCGDCGFRFALDAQHPPAGGLGVCPNCGYTENRLSAAALGPADRVLIDRWRLLGRTPARGAIVAAGLRGSGLAVKRVAGLPGERPAIADGDLYAAGDLIRKAPAELRALQVLVHDNDFQPRTAGLPPRWRPVTPSSNWQATSSGFRNRSTSTQAAELDWLAYQHWACTGNPLQPRAAATPVYDYDSFNQGENRALRRVADVTLTCRLRLGAAGRLAFAAQDGERRFEVLIEPGRRLVVTSGGQRLLERRLATELFWRSADVQFGFCDRQVLLTAGGRTLVRMPYERAPAAAAGSRHPLAIGASGMAVEVTQLKVWRDIYYLEPGGPAQRWQTAVPLAATEVALLGDNQPVSIDSRHWREPGVPLANLLGRVYRPFWSPRR